MRARFNIEVGIEIIDVTDPEDEEVVICTKNFQEGEEIEVILICSPSVFYYVQFPDGTVAYIHKCVLEVLYLEETEKDVPKQHG